MYGQNIMKNYGAFTYTATRDTFCIDSHVIKSRRYVAGDFAIIWQSIGNVSRVAVYVTDPLNIEGKIFWLLV